MCYFSSFGGHETCVERTELQSILENFNWNFQWNKTHFSDWLGKGFEIPAYEKNRIFEVKSVVGSYRDSLLKAVTCALPIIWWCPRVGCFLAFC